MMFLWMMEEFGMSMKYCIESMMTELWKIRLVILPGGTKLPYERTKEQHWGFMPNRDGRSGEKYCQEWIKYIGV